jgi:phosphatidylserine decarboxylase
MAESGRFGVDAKRAGKILGFNTTSRLAGKLADARLPAPFLRAAIKAYSKAFGVDLDEAARGLAEFPTFGDFFARELRPGQRVVNESPDVLVSPCDGTVHNFGTITGGRLEQVKGREYTVAELLGDEAAAAGYEGGTYCTIYLSPSNYHRVHSPVDGRIAGCRRIAGALYSVQPFFTRHLWNLFAANERIPIHLQTEHGPVCVVMVGATIVGRCVVNFADVDTNRPGGSEAPVTFDPPLAVSRGDELGAFKIGSTVVLLTTPAYAPRMLVERMPVQMGAALMELRKPDGKGR